MKPKPTTKRHRFSLLYLEDQEISTHHYAATLDMTDSITKKAIKENGMVFINSKSFIFEPLNPEIPLYKFLFSHFIPNKNYNKPGGQPDLMKCPKKVKFHKEAILQFKTKRIFEIKVMRDPEDPISAQIDRLGAQRESNRRPTTLPVRCSATTYPTAPTCS